VNSYIKLGPKSRGLMRISGTGKETSSQAIVKVLVPSIAGGAGSHKASTAAPTKPKKINAGSKKRKVVDDSDDCSVECSTTKQLVVSDGDTDDKTNVSKRKGPTITILFDCWLIPNGTCSFSSSQVGDLPLDINLLLEAHMLAKQRRSKSKSTQTNAHDLHQSFHICFRCPPISFFSPCSLSRRIRICSAGWYLALSL
jgi:hypothetical protein